MHPAEGTYAGPRTTMVPICGAPWVYALAVKYGKHMGRQACWTGDELAIGPLREPGVAVKILHAYIWGIGSLGQPSHITPTH